MKKSGPTKEISSVEKLFMKMFAKFAHKLCVCVCVVAGARQYSIFGMRIFVKFSSKNSNRPRAISSDSKNEATSIEFLLSCFFSFIFQKFQHTLVDSSEETSETFEARIARVLRQQPVDIG